MSEARLPLFCPSKLLLAFFRRGRSNAHYLHWAYSFYFWQSRSRSRWTRGVLALLIWPPVLLACQAHLLPRLGPKVKAMTGKGPLRQWVEQLQVAWLWSINPMEYYSFELFDDDRRARAGAYLLRHQFKGGLHNILECDVDPRHPCGCSGRPGDRRSWSCAAP